MVPRPSSPGQARSLCSVRHPGQQGTEAGVGSQRGQSRRTMAVHGHSVHVRASPPCHAACPPPARHSDPTRRGRRPPALTCLGSPTGASAPPSHELPRRGSGHRAGPCRFCQKQKPGMPKDAGGSGREGEGGATTTGGQKRGVRGWGAGGRRTKRDGGSGVATKEKHEERRA